MRITRDEVRHVAALARLRLTEAEEKQLAGDLDAILAWVEQLREVDTENVPVTAHVLDLDSPMRADQVTNEPDPEGLLANAPDRSGTFFRVPRILE